MPSLPFFRRPRYPYSAIEVLSGASVQVPADFVGIHVHNWPKWRPSAGPVGLPPFGFAWARAQAHVFSDGAGADAGPLVWSRLHSAPGVYAWQSNDEIDDIFDALAAQDMKMIFDLQSTPDWASSGQTPDPWGAVGGNVAPDNHQHLADFMTALLTRYGSVIRVVEVWNEPDFGAERGFYIGTPASLVAVAATLRTVIDAVDPTIELLAPCYDLDAFLDAGGGQYVDGCALHSYTHGIVHSQGVDLPTYILMQRQVMAQHGLAALPLWETERGFHADAVSLAGFIAQIGDGSAQAIADETRRVLLVEAAMGLRACLLYSHGTGLHGDTLDSVPLQQAIDWAHTTLAGSTLSYCRINADRTVTAVLDGVTLTI